MMIQKVKVDHSLCAGKQNTSTCRVAICLTTPRFRLISVCPSPVCCVRWGPNSWRKTKSESESESGFKQSHALQTIYMNSSFTDLTKCKPRASNGYGICSRFVLAHAWCEEPVNHLPCWVVHLHGVLGICSKFGNVPNEANLQYLWFDHVCVCVCFSQVLWRMHCRSKNFCKSEWSLSLWYIRYTYIHTYIWTHLRVPPKSIDPHVRLCRNEGCLCQVLVKRL